MERRTIGAAALEVGAVGLGCMPMSWAYSGSRQRGDESLRTVHTALDRGATLLDTADMYGPFTNELLVGRALKERRSKRSCRPRSASWWANSTSWPTAAPAM